MSVTVPDWLPTSFNGQPEIWKFSALSLIAVSSQGRVFNVRTTRFMRGGDYGKGHLGVNTDVTGGQKFSLISRLVAEAFVPVPPDLAGKHPRVKHLDGDVKNNVATNLVWTLPNQGVNQGDDWVPLVEPISCREPSGESHQERWARFRGSQYYVSTLARVFSAKSMKLIRAHREETGYWRTGLRGLGHFFLHRLVGEAFVPGRTPERDTVNHKDGNPNNNAVWNCEWATPREQAVHAAETGLLPSGSSHHNAKLTDEQVTEARALYASGEWPFERIAQHLGVSRQSATRAVLGETDYDASLPPLPTDPAVATLAKQQAAIRYRARDADQRAAVKAMRLQRPKRTSTERLDVATVLALRAALKSEPAQVVADRFNLNLYTVMAVRDGRTYAWVTGPDSQPPKTGPKFDKPEETDRLVVTADLVTRILELRTGGKKLKDIAGAVGLHPGTVKLIVGGRHPLQKRGLAPGPSTRRPREQPVAADGH